MDALWFIGQHFMRVLCLTSSQHCIETLSKLSQLSFQVLKLIILLWKVIY